MTLGDEKGGFWGDPEGWKQIKTKTKQNKTKQKTSLNTKLRKKKVK